MTVSSGYSIIGDKLIFITVSIDSIDSVIFHVDNLVIQITEQNQALVEVLYL